MKVLVLGVNGLLGSNVPTAVENVGGEPLGTYHTTNPLVETPCYQLDIRDRKSLTGLLDRIEPDLVVNCTAMTDVDECEKNPESAQEVNAKAPASIAKLCEKQDIAFTHVSTDYVFDGQAKRPYVVDAPTNPIQVYGRSKLAGEQAVRENHSDPTVVRLSFVYGIHRGRGELEGFPRWFRDRLMDKERTPLFTDQWVTPTRAGQAAETIVKLYDNEVTGLYHVSCRSCVTPHEFGSRIRELMGVSSKYVEEGSMEDIDRPADRPAYSCLNVSSLEKTIGQPQPSLADDLAAIQSAFD